MPRPCLPDCKPIYNHVAGPKNHVLCKTHGHVYDEAALMIIANSVKEYDAQYPIPRPMQPDCKGVKGQLPYAPKNIMVCEHGHVLDIGKGQIVGNTRTMYLRAHPEYAGPPRKASPDPPSPPPKPSGGGSCNIEITKRDSIVNYLHVFVSVAADGSWDALLGWTYSGIEWLPDRVFCQITLIDNADRDGKEYSMTTDPTPVQSSDAEYHTNLKASTKIAYGGQVYVRATVYSTVKQTSVIGAESSFDVSLLSGQG